MKKLIAIAVLASMGGAFAACEYVAPDTAWVYKWKFTGKTTFGKKPGKVKTTSGLCGYTGTTATQECTVRAPASLKIEGYTWYCSPVCGSDTFENFAEVNEIFWQKKPFKASIAGGVSTDVSNIIGKKATKFEAAGTASFTENVENSTYTLTYAGLGAYSTKNSRVKNVKGNFAGFLSQPWYISKSACVTAGYWNCEDLSLVCTGTSVAYGKWSATYKKTLSKKYLKYGFTSGKPGKVPSWVVYMNAQ